MIDPPEASSPPRRRLRFSIRGMFYLTACFCLALTVGAGRSGLGEADWSVVLLTLATLGVATELLCQASAVRGTPRYAIARLVRYVAVSAMLGCLGLRVAERCGWLIRAERGVMNYLPFWGDPFPDAIWYTLLMAGASVLYMGSGHQSERFTRGKTLGVMAALVVCTAFYLAFLLSEFSIIVYLVHVATAGIEAAESLAWQRPGLFPDHVGEGYFTYWAVTAAAGLTALAACLVVGFARARRSDLRTVLFVGFAIVCATLAAFIWWYFHIELPRISPDIAISGWSFTTSQAAGGTVLLLIVALWMACLLAREDENATLTRRVRPFAALPTWLATAGLLLGGGMLVTRFAFEAIQYHSAYFAITAWAALPDVTRMLLLSPRFVMQLALTAAGVRLAWSAWRRNQVRISRLPAGRTATVFMMVVLLGLVGIPTLAAYSFGSWLGPWWR